MNQKNLSKKITAPFFLISSTNSVTESFLTKSASFLEVFRDVSKNNDHVALIYDKDQLTYRVLDAISNQFAHFYKNKGISNGDLVGICLERNIHLVPALLGILKAGACYVPLDPHFPQSRLSYMIEHSKLKYIISAENLTGHFECDKSVDVILIDKESTTLHNSSTSNPGITLHGDMLAYTIYTSGSTGTPKGVQIHHKALLNFLVSMQKEPGITPSDRMLAITTLSFDISCLELYLPLISGATIVLASSEIARDANRLIEYISTHHITIMQATPSTYQMLFDLHWKNHSVKKILCGGEAMSIDLGNKLQAFCSEVWNMYGPTETTIWSSTYQLQGENDKPVLGKPIDNTSLILLDEALQPVGETGGEGELYIGGLGLSKGYLNGEDLTRERFIPCPFPELRSEKLYKTGDICRYVGEGTIEYIGRSDFQVKIRGYRIELGEIENTILHNESVRQCVVTVREDIPGFKKLVAYIIEVVSGNFSVIEQKKQLKSKLPDYMVPDIFIVVTSFPLTPNGKIERNALPKPGKERPELSSQFIQPITETEKTIARVWSSLLSIDTIGTDDNFFDIGGNSLLGMRAGNILLGEHGIDIPIVKLFENPTIAKLAAFLSNNSNSISIIDKINDRATYQRIGRFTDDIMSDGVAIIGMSGKFPGADTVEKLWDNLCNGVESISRFTKEEAGPGIEPSLLNDPDYILARGIINDADKFDAAFFGISPSEAKLMDPQHRVFLELAYQSLENAGYDPEQFPGLIGIYAGAGDNFYYTNNVLHHSDLVNMVGKTVVGYGNYKDYIATRASYHLNCTGPGVSMNTGCSTTLLTVDYAFQGLINHECDMALAGGIDICVPQKSGFLYQLNGTFAKDGHCRPFDAEATGTMFCDGAGIVVLKRLKDAIRDRDKIYAVIRGSAKNNDGNNKASFLAPSSEGQSKVIAMAQAIANVSATDIGYIEAHGTGTPIGDPIEIEGLTKAFRLHTDKNQFCYLSSIKGNIGHPTNAAGIAGLIKAALCLYHEKIPATMHFTIPNPKIDFKQTPFMVTTHLTEWKKSTTPRIAGVSSFGFGGTNVHTIIAESPVSATPSVSARPFHLFPLSAKTEASLDRLTSDFSSFFTTHPDIFLADVSYTLTSGRKNHGHRRFIVANTCEAAAAACASLPPDLSGEHYCEVREKAVCFMFPGQGAQYIGMGKNLYDTEPLYREVVDYCASVINKYLKKDILEILFKETGNADDEFDSLKNTYYTQPAIFITEYASARLLMGWGIQPSVMIGHSIGEFVCATLSGIFTLDDALRLIALRGRLVSELPHGSMLSVRKNRDVIEPLLPETIQLATHNSPDLCVVAGPTGAIAAFSATLEKKGIISKQLHTSHAFHSAMMDPALKTFIGEVQKITIGTPAIPFLSTLTNTWVGADYIPDATYWGRHMREPVLFSGAIRELLNEKTYAFIEIGPRNTLSTLSRQHPEAPGNPIVALLSDTSSDFEECRALHHALGSLWMHGVSIDWKAYYKGELRYKIPLPLYPFEKSRYWVDPPLTIPLVATSIQTVEAAPVSHQQAPAPAAPSGGPDEVLPRLTSAISEVFGKDISSYGTKTTFIEMGMDSLFLTQVAYKIREQFKIKITFGHLLKEFPNLKRLAAHIQENVLITPPQAVPLVPVPTKSNLEFSTNTPNNPKNLSAFDSLQRLLSENGVVVDQHLKSNLQTFCQSFIKKTNADILVPTPEQNKLRELTVSLQSDAYQMHRGVLIKLSGNLSPTLLKESFVLLVSRHEALRMHFDASGSHIVIDPPMTPDISEEHFEPDTITTIIERISEISKSNSFLSMGSLVKVHFLYSGTNTIFIYILCHSTICDGWSLDVITEDIVSIYNNLQKNSNPPAIVGFDFADYLLSNGSPQQTDETMEAAATYWREIFSKYAFISLPTDIQSSDNRSGRLTLSLPQEYLEQLRLLSKQNGTSLFASLISVLAILFSKITGKLSFGVTHLLADQSLLNQYSLVGACTNIIPFPVIINTKNTFISHLELTNQQLIDNYRHTSGSIHRFLQDSKNSAWPNNLYNCPVIINHTKIFEPQNIKNDDFNVSYCLNPIAMQPTQLTIDILESSEQLEIQFTYNSIIFSDKTISAWLLHFKTITDHVLADNSISLKSLLDFEFPQKTASTFVTNNNTNLAHFFSPSYTQYKPTNYKAPSTSHQFSTEKQEELLLSSSQKRLWFFHLFAPNSSAYNLALTITIKGTIDKELLETSLKTVIERHETFKTCFVNNGGNASVKVYSHPIFNILHENITTTNLENPTSLIDVSIRHNANIPFILEQLPLHKTIIYHLSPTEATIVLFTPHILIDGWSFNIFYNELRHTYRQLLKNLTPELPKISGGYTEFSKWEHNKLSQTNINSQLAYWKEHLGTDLPILQLPYDYTRPNELSTKGSVHFFSIPKPTLDTLKHVGKTHDASLFAILLTAFHIFLHKYSGQQKIIIGTPFANKEEQQFENVIGFFLKMIPTKSVFYEDSTVSNLINTIRKEFYDSLLNSDIPLETLIRELNIPRNLNTQPLFQTIFTYQNYISDPTPGEDPTFEQRFVNRGIAEYDLSVYMWESDNSIEGAIEYSTDLFNLDTITRMAHHFNNVISTIANSPDILVSSISMLGPIESEQIISGWNNTLAEYPSGNSFIDLFQTIAYQYPSSTAIICNADKINYSELNADSNRIAHFLKNKGVKNCDLIGICLERNISLVTIVLGILKAGATYIPLDPSFPKDRLSYMLDDAQPPYIISTQKLLDHFTCPKNSNVLLIETIDQILPSQDAFDLNEISNTNSICYIIYTSGSTGKPKGVQITHRSLLNFLNSMQHNPGLKKDDIMLALTTLSFDISCLEIYLPLITGATIVLTDKQTSKDSTRLITYIQQNNVTVIQATPATYQMMYVTGWKPNKNTKILVGGEALPIDLAERLTQDSDNVWNMYGPTETTVWSVIYHLTSTDSIILIGKPIFNTQIYILDTNLLPVPVGVTGELFIGGDGVSPGYFNRPDLTKERFIDSLFIPSTTIYKTGDLARYLPDGNIECLGRTDFQVKIRGFRIELGDIENNIAKFKGIKEAVCSVLSKNANDKKLIAYTISDSPYNEAELRDFLKSKLPDYMIPNIFIELDAFPLTHNGKVDRKALPEPAVAAKSINHPITAPTSDTEKQLSEIWKKVLKIESISTDDNFFNIGGHSFLAAILFAEIQKTMSVNLPLALLFDAPTIGQLASSIDSKSLAEKWRSLVSIKKSGTKRPLFLAHGAEGNVLIYRPLIPHFDSDRPLYGLQAQGLDGKSAIFTTIEQTAEHYVKEIRTVQPHGPYLLGGYCLGGQIAYEMAQQLVHAGEEVRYVCMFEAFNEAAHKTPISPLVKYSNKILNLYFHFSNLVHAHGSSKNTFFKEKVVVLQERIKNHTSFYSRLLRHKKPNPEFLKFHHLKIGKVYDDALARYTPLPYTGNVDLFITRERFLKYHDPLCGLKDLVQGDLKVHEVPCSARGSFVDPYVRYVAETLKQRLDSIDIM